MEYRQESEKTVRRIWIATIIGMVFIIGLLVSANAYGSYLYRIDEAERYAIAERRGGEPVCSGPEGIYIRFSHPEWAEWAERNKGEQG